MLLQSLNLLANLCKCAWSASTKTGKIGCLKPYVVVQFSEWICEASKSIVDGIGQLFD